MWLKQVGTYIGLECADGSGDEGMCVLVVVKANVCGIGCSGSLVIAHNEAVTLDVVQR